MRAIDYEIERQTKLINAGEPIIQETRKFNDNRGVNSAMRSKENAHDYRYFKEPDVIPVHISEDDIAKIKATMPVLIDERLDIYMNKYALTKTDAKILVADKKYLIFMINL